MEGVRERKKRRTSDGRWLAGYLVLSRRPACCGSVTDCVARRPFCLFGGTAFAPFLPATCSSTQSYPLLPSISMTFFLKRLCTLVSTGVFRETVKPHKTRGFYSYTCRHSLRMSNTVFAIQALPQVTFSNNKDLQSIRAVNFSSVYPSTPSSQQ